MEIIVWLGIIFISAGIGYALGAGKGNGTLGFLLSLLLGPLGWVVVLMLKPGAGQGRKVERLDPVVGDYLRERRARQGGSGGRRVMAAPVLREGVEKTEG